MATALHPHAPSCSAGSVDKCGECQKGFRLNATTNACVPCGVANCLDCDEQDRCKQCLPGYGLAEPQDAAGYDYKVASSCHACTKQDSNCNHW